MNEHKVTISIFAMHETPHECLYEYPFFEKAVVTAERNKTTKKMEYYKEYKPKYPECIECQINWNTKLKRWDAFAVHEDHLAGRPIPKRIFKQRQADYSPHVIEAYSPIKKSAFEENRLTLEQVKRGKGA